MNKKMYLWIVIGLVVVIAIIYLLVSATGSGNSTTQTPGGSTAKPVGGNSQLIVPSGEATPGTPVVTQENASVVPPTEAVKQQKVSDEVVIEANSKGFTPKTITVALGTRAFLTFVATDDNEHVLTSDDPKLPLLVVFSKKEGKKSTSFETPPAGSYTFYIDSKENAGTFIVK